MVIPKVLVRLENNYMLEKKGELVRDWQGLWLHHRGWWFILTGGL